MTVKKPKILELKLPMAAKTHSRTHHAASVPLIIDSPHSGTQLPADFHFACSLADLRQSDEFYVDRFGELAVNHGATFLRALTSRAYIDLNRPLGDIAPELCGEKIPWPLTPSRRSQHGIGLIRHLVRPNEPVYDGTLSLDDIRRRIDNYYTPYYDVLGEHIHALRDRFGMVVHINLHAMPSIGADSKPMPDIVLGDHDGHSSGRLWRETVKKLLEKQGLKVVVNNPYKGVELTKRFAKPRQGIHCLQLEVNKALYMSEENFAIHDGMAPLLRMFDDVWRELAAFIGDMAQEKEVPSKAAE